MKIVESTVALKKKDKKYMLCIAVEKVPYSVYSSQYIRFESL